MMCIIRTSLLTKRCDKNRYSNKLLMNRFYSIPTKSLCCHITIQSSYDEDDDNDNDPHYHSIYTFPLTTGNNSFSKTEYLEVIISFDKYTRRERQRTNYES